jgi:superfamily II helicase
VITNTDNNEATAEKNVLSFACLLALQSPLIVPSHHWKLNTMTDTDTTEFSAESVDANVVFADLGLDDRLLRGLAKLNFTKPTPVQAKSIPLALAGRDILAKARTGSGKTAAFMLPLIHKILAAKDVTFYSVGSRVWVFRGGSPGLTS